MTTALEVLRQKNLGEKETFLARCKTERFVVWGFVPLVVASNQYRRTTMWGRFDHRRDDINVDTDGFFLSNQPLQDMTATDINIHRPPLCILPSKFIIGLQDSLYIDDDGGVWLGYDNLPLCGPMSKLRQAEFTRHVEKSSRWQFMPYWKNRLHLDGTMIIIK